MISGSIFFYQNWLTFLLALWLSFLLTKAGMAVLLDLYTGLRKGELLGLPWKNVHIDLNGESYLRIIKHLPVWTSAQSFMFPC